DALVLDDHWWHKGSSQPLDGSVLPKSLGSLSQTLKARGSGLGMYLPFTRGGFGGDNFSKQSENPDQRSLGGSEAPGDCSITDPKYWDDLKIRLRDFYQANSLRFVRHDLNEIVCQSAGQREGIEARLSVQAAVDTWIELLRLERSLN